MNNVRNKKERLRGYYRICKCRLNCKRSKNKKSMKKLHCCSKLLCWKTMNILTTCSIAFVSPNPCWSPSKSFFLFFFFFLVHCMSRWSLVFLGLARGWSSSPFSSFPSSLFSASPPKELSSKARNKFRTYKKCNILKLQCYPFQMRVTHIHSGNAISYSILAAAYQEIACKYMTNFWPMRCGVKC